MKITKYFAALALLVCPAAANASDLITIDPDGLGAGGSITVGSLDWSPGNSLSLGAIPISAPGTSFQNVFQADLGTFEDGSGNPVLGTGLGSSFEWTVVASFAETVTALLPFPLDNGSPLDAGFAGGPDGIPDISIAGFGIGAGFPNFIEIYYDPVAGTASSDLAGSGFNDGILILSAHVTNLQGSFTANTAPGTAQTGGLSIDPVTGMPYLDQFGGTNDYPNQATVSGTGSVSVTALVDFSHSDFFQLPAGTKIGVSFTNTSLQDPFLQTDPSAMFALSSGGVAPVLAGAGVGVASLGTVNGYNGPDFQFQSDANTSFQIVPEPSSFVLMGMGLIGVAGVAVRRRRNKKQAA